MNSRHRSLLSIFYKLASACITRRIKPVLTQLVGTEQKAYLSEKNIGSVIMNLVNIIHYCNSKKKAALLLLVDFQKAFDSINHTFMGLKVVKYIVRKSQELWGPYHSPLWSN